jgi:hypothetical protein
MFSFMMMPNARYVRFWYIIPLRAVQRCGRKLALMAVIDGRQRGITGNATKCVET